MKIRLISLCFVYLYLATIDTNFQCNLSSQQIPPSDPDKYPTFFRIVPTLSVTADALATIVSHFRWKYVAIITAGEYCRLDVRKGFYELCSFKFCDLNRYVRQCLRQTSSLTAMKGKVGCL